MTPNTLSYMIAGFIVIIIGIIGYAVSLLIRNNNLRKQLWKLDDKE